MRGDAREQPLRRCEKQNVLIHLLVAFPNLVDQRKHHMPHGPYLDGARENGGQDLLPVPQTNTLIKGITYTVVSRLSAASVN